MSDTTETETNTDNTDTTDEPSKAELHDRVRKLESTVEKLMPSRRDALKLGAAGIAGAAGLSATTQTADASTGSAGQIGDPSNRPTIFADDIDANQLTGVSTGADIQGCRVFLSSNQNISGGNHVKIQFDSEAYDSDSNFDTSSHAWTCPKDGLYAVNLQVRFRSGNLDEQRQVTIGSATALTPTNKAAINQHRSADTFDYLSVSSVNKYNQGDTIAAYASNKISNDTLGGRSNNKTFLEVAFLGGL